jgi:hypothetical protein
MTYEDFEKCVGRLGDFWLDEPMPLLQNRVRIQTIDPKTGRPRKIWAKLRQICVAEFHPEGSVKPYKTYEVLVSAGWEKDRL